MKIRRVYAAIALLALLAVLAPWCAAQQITVAAAADLQFAFQDVATRFEKANGTKVKLTFGSSGNFFAQIQNGAPFDLFFSADLDYCKRLEAAGLIDPASLYEYAVGKIVLWVPAGSHLDLSRGPEVLLDPGIHKIAIANPEHAPYGRAAVAALRQEKIYDRIAGKLVLGENISQTASFVVSGSADVGIVALSLALAPSLKDKGRFVEIPAGDYPPIEQGAVVLKSSPAKPAARQFMEFVKSAEIVDLLKIYGFTVPGSPGTKH